MSAIGVINGVQKSSTPVIKTGVGTAAEVNAGRVGWRIQNMGQNPLFMAMSNTVNASATTPHAVLAAGTADDNGSGGAYAEMSGSVWTGKITVAGINPRYIIQEYNEFFM